MYAKGLGLGDIGGPVGQGGMRDSAQIINSDSLMQVDQVGHLQYGFIYHFQSLSGTGSVGRYGEYGEWVYVRTI